jgi:copper(I)-binding protein
MDAPRIFAGFTCAIAGAALMAAATTAARGAGSGTLGLQDPWARPAAVGATDAAYLSIDNQTRRADALIGAQSAVAAAISIHESRMVGQVMTMRPLAALDIPARTRVTLAPGGLHLMMTGLRRALRPGDRFSMALTFAKAGRRNVEFGVAAGPPAQANSPMRM